MFWENMGVPVKPRDKISPSVHDPLVNRPEDIAGLPSLNPEKEGTLRSSLQALHMLSESVGGRVAVCAGSLGPFTYAAMLRGIEDFTKGLYRSPDFALKLIEWSLESQKTWIQTLKANGALVVNVADPCAGFINPAQFDNFAFPFLKSLFEEITRQNMYSIMHVCGWIGHILDRVPRIGCDCLWIDQNVGTKDARAKVGDLCLMGNVDPVSVLLQGKVDNVRVEANKCIKEGVTEGAFILGGGCEIPTFTPVENLVAFVREARNYHS